MGYIQLDREKCQKFEFYKEPLTMHFFIHCLLIANYKDLTFKGEIIHRGEFVRTVKNLANETGLSIQNVRTCIKKLESTSIDANMTSNINSNMDSSKILTQRKTKKMLIYSINNYDYFLGLTTNQQKTNTKTNNKSTQSKEVKEIEEVVGDEMSPTTDYTDDFLKFWKAYIKKTKYKADTFNYWSSRNYDEETIKDIIYGAKCYSEEMKDNKRAMVYPRTFLINEMWQGYERPKERTSEEYQAYVNSLIGNLTTDTE